MFAKFVVLFAGVVACHGGIIGHGHGSQGHGVSSQSFVQDHGIQSHDFHHEDHHSNENAYPRYEYKYSVSDDVTGDQKSHSESRDGGNVEGRYSLVQPDGSTRTVTYKADDHNGFQAEVQTTGGNQQHQHGGYHSFDDFNAHNFHH